MSQPGFWDDQERSQAVIQEAKKVKGVLEQYKTVKQAYDELELLLQMVDEEPGSGLEQDLQEQRQIVDKLVEQLELEAMLNGEYDSHNAIVAIHPGAGGTESQDWAQMLLRMYTRWAERRGFSVKTLDFLPGDEAGIKSVTLLIEGDNAYGYLQAEKGVHRLVRISPFDSSGRRHTSFASVDVTPEVDDDLEVQITSDDLRVDTFRSSGAGGQHVNTTDSAIRITHLPTGLVASCQTERSQHANRDSAMKILRSKLADRMLAEQRAKMDEFKGEQGEIAWGNQIRSYVFCPYTMVKDHRTNAEIGNVDSVMDGQIDPFIEAYLRSQSHS